MGEAGGPATQGGIFFQNTIAALYLGRMLDLRSRASCDRVVHVRVEAPEFVDDMVVRFADGSRCFIQAKRSIMRSSSNEWNALWGNLLRQF